MIEIGIPFSDPVADGIVIQQSSAMAIQNGFNMADLMVDIASFRSVFSHIPLVIMTYLNPIVQYGVHSFMTDAIRAGIDGVLMVDLPPDHYSRLGIEDDEASRIFLVTPTTTPSRLSIIHRHASGFIYYVSTKGVTGSTMAKPSIIADHLATLREHIALPIMIGFGIDSVQTAQQMAQIADGIIIGSAFIRPFIDSSNHDITQETQLNFLSRMAQAI